MVLTDRQSWFAQGGVLRLLSDGQGDGSEGEVHSPLRHRDGEIRDLRQEAGLHAELRLQLQGEPRSHGATEPRFSLTILGVVLIKNLKVFFPNTTTNVDF